MALLAVGARLLGIAGSYVGSLASAAVPATVLLAGFGVLMLTVAATMIMRRRRAPCLPSPGRQPRSGVRHAAVVTGVGLVTGLRRRQPAAPGRPR